MQKKMQKIKQGQLINKNSIRKVIFLYKNPNQQTQKPSFQLDKQQKHRLCVLDQWLKTQITYKQDLEAALKVVKLRIQLQKLIQSSQKLHNMFPVFQQMLGLSKQMIQIISIQIKKHINQVMIGKKLNKSVGFYKFYLQYFQKKSEMKNIYDEIERLQPDKLRTIEKQLQNYFVKMYEKNNQNQENKINNTKVNITILDCLERPLYRLFKYPLLIDSYLKKLPKEHADYLQLKKTRQQFDEISNKCNNFFTQQQKQQLKNKLQKLYGRSLSQTSQYKCMMSAETLYFSSKLYIFNNLIIISIIDKLIGFRQQKLYMNMGIDQFSFISYRKDFKYFKNILILCGIYQCIHLFLPDKGTRLQIYHLVNQIIQEQKMKAFQKRQHKQTKLANQIMFYEDEKKNAHSYLTGLKIQVVDIDMREINFLTNDTAFILNVSIPEYIDDQATYLKNSENRLNDGEKKYNQNRQNIISDRGSLTQEEAVIVSRIGPVAYKKAEHESEIFKVGNYCTINQFIQIQLEDLISLHNRLKQNFPQVKLPQIDPLSKDFNFYTQSKKKTKSFQVRAILIEQFFNFIFRHPTIMQSPLDIIKTLGINQSIWQYVDKRSIYLKSQSHDQSLSLNQTSGNKYDNNHCDICIRSQINSIQDFQCLRRLKINNRQFKPSDKNKYCFNFVNLLRNNLLSLNLKQFDTIDRMLIYGLYYDGRVDYCFIYKKYVAKQYKTVKVSIPKLNKIYQRDNQHENTQFFITSSHPTDHKTTVGMILNQIAKDIQISNILDYRIILFFNKQQRILDQDQFLHKIIQKYDLQYTDQSIQDISTYKSSIRNSISIEKKITGFFNYVKNVIPLRNKNKPILLMKKIIYFPLCLQIQSGRMKKQRFQLIIAEIFYKISISEYNCVGQNVWMQMCAMYYCLHCGKEQLKKFNLHGKEKEVGKYCEDIVSKQNKQLINNKVFIENVIQKIINYQKTFLQQCDYQKLLFNIYQSIVKLSYQQFLTHTYFVPVTSKTVAQFLILDSKGKVPSQCYMGINFCSLTIHRDMKSFTPCIILPLQDIQICHSVYSIFITYKSHQINKNDGLINQVELRFDSKMLYGLAQLCEKYKFMKEKFHSLYGKEQNGK